MNHFSYAVIHLIIGLLYGQCPIAVLQLTSNNGHIELPRTMTFTEEAAGKPQVLFIRGLGNSLRNRNQSDFRVKACYIKELRNTLNTNEITFYANNNAKITQNNILLCQDIFVFEVLVQDAKNFKKVSTVKGWSRSII